MRSIECWRRQGSRSGRYTDHLRSWWPKLGSPDALFVCFEDMKADLPGAVRRIAAFIGCPLDAELLEVVVHQSSIGFMQRHPSRFDDHP